MEPFIFQIQPFFICISYFFVIGFKIEVLLSIFCKCGHCNSSLEVIQNEKFISVWVALQREKRCMLNRISKNGGFPFQTTPSEWDRFRSQARHSLSDGQPSAWVSSCWLWKGWLMNDRRNCPSADNQPWNTLERPVLALPVQPFSLHPHI